MIEFPKDFKEFLQLLNSKEVESFKANFISKGDLLINKRASGRPKDLVDYSKLQDD
jgi:hypothetical protein